MKKKLCCLLATIFLTVCMGIVVYAEEMISNIEWYDSGKTAIKFKVNEPGYIDWGIITPNGAHWCIGSQNITDTSNLHYGHDLFTKIRNNNGESGEYTPYVIWYSDSVSVDSGMEYTGESFYYEKITETIAAPTNLSWEGTVLWFDAAEGVTDYMFLVYKTDWLAANQDVTGFNEYAPNTDSIPTRFIQKDNRLGLDFAQYFDAPEENLYYVTVYSNKFIRERNEWISSEKVKSPYYGSYSPKDTTVEAKINRILSQENTALEKRNELSKVGVWEISEATRENEGVWDGIMKLEQQLVEEQGLNLSVYSTTKLIDQSQVKVEGLGFTYLSWSSDESLKKLEVEFRDCTEQNRQTSRNCLDTTSYKVVEPFILDMKKFAYNYIPMRITLPIPKGINPKSVRVIEFDADALKVESIKLSEVHDNKVTFFIKPDNLKMLAFASLDTSTWNNTWDNVEKKAFWYEEGTKQGTDSDPKGVVGDGTVRGREIYDAQSDGWYWLDAVKAGSKAVSKEVWMPYIYQDETTWNEDKIVEVASESGDMKDQVVDFIKTGKGKWVRYDENGKMYKGWYTVEGEDSLLYPTQVGNTYYYDHQTGLMAKGYITIDGTRYHFNEVTGALDK